MFGGAGSAEAVETSGSSALPPNKGMKLTKLRAAPELQAEVPPCAFRRFAAARSLSPVFDEPTEAPSDVAVDKGGFASGKRC